MMHAIFPTLNNKIVQKQKSKSNYIIMPEIGQFKQGVFSLIRMHAAVRD